MIKKNYLIENYGCDDTTSTEIELTNDEFEAIRKFAIENNKNSSYGCQPKIGIYDTFTKEGDGCYEYDYTDDLTEI